MWRSELVVARMNKRFWNIWNVFSQKRAWEWGVTSFTWQPLLILLRFSKCYSEVSNLPKRATNTGTYYLYSNEHLSIKGPDKDNHHCLVLTSCHFGRVWCTTVNYTITFLVPRRLKPVTTQKSFIYKCSNQVLRYLKVHDRKPISSDVFWRRNYGVILRRLRQKGIFNTAG